MEVTVAWLLNKGKDRLGSAGLEDSAISAELLLRSVLKLDRAQLILNSSQVVTPDQEKEYNTLLEKRANREPLQYLTGWVDFYNIHLRCDKRALIPRPETEILVETVIRKLDRFANPRILDIGVGSGNIIISAIKNIETAYGVGTDISTDALELAAYNARHNNVSNRMDFKRGDIFDRQFIDSLGLYDCVISNPPYVALTDKGTMQPEITDYEPAIAVFAGDDPLRFFKTIIGSISYILKAGGILAFEIGMGQADEISNMMRASFTEIEITKDLASIERVITGKYAGPDKK
jgi:release factor glutamine methyltransferase